MRVKPRASVKIVDLSESDTLERQEIKTRISAMLEDYPVYLLEEVLDYVTQKQETIIEPSYDRYLEKILRENRELLQKLAQ